MARVGLSGGLFSCLNGIPDLLDQIGGGIVPVVPADGDRRHTLLGVVKPAVTALPLCLDTMVNPALRSFSPSLLSFQAWLECTQNVNFVNKK